MEKKEEARKQIALLLENDLEGVEEYLLNNYDDLIKFLKVRTIAMNTTEGRSIEKIASELLFDLEVPRNVCGYQYAVEGIVILCNLEGYKNVLITKDIYPEIAKKFKTTIGSVNNGIRHLVNNRINVANLEKYGYKIATKEGLTNFEFLTMCCNIVKEIQGEGQSGEDIKQDKLEVELIDGIEDMTEEEKVIKYLKMMSIPRNLRGFNYLIEAIKIYSQDYNVSLTKELYPSVAKKFNTTSYGAERSIRTAIKIGFKRTDPEDIVKIFGSACSTSTVGMFISVISNLVNERKRDDQDESQEFQDEMTEKKIIKYLQKMSIPQNIKGFRYLIEAIKIYSKSPNISLIKELYPSVAEKFDTTSRKVERAIRHAIERGYGRANPENIFEIFGSTYSSDKGKATNGEFIAMIASLL